MVALIGPIGTTELIVILAILLILFGRRLPEVMRSMGRGVSEFKKGISEDEQKESEGGTSGPDDVDQKSDSPMAG